MYDLHNIFGTFTTLAFAVAIGLCCYPGVYAGKHLAGDSPNRFQLVCANLLAFFLAMLPTVYLVGGYAAMGVGFVRDKMSSSEPIGFWIWPSMFWLSPMIPYAALQLKDEAGHAYRALYANCVVAAAVLIGAVVAFTWYPVQTIQPWQWLPYAKAARNYPETIVTRAYGEKMSKVMAEYQRHAADVNSLAEASVLKNPENLRKIVVDCVAALKTRLPNYERLYAEIRTLKPPEKLKGFHEALVLFVDGDLTACRRVVELGDAENYDECIHAIADYEKERIAAAEVLKTAAEHAGLEMSGGPG